MSSHPFFRLGLSQVPANLAERLGGLKQPTPPAPKLEGRTCSGLGVGSLALLPETRPELFTLWSHKAIEHSD